MKHLAIMQPYLFPYIGYFQLINTADEFVIYDDVQFIKGGWINRNNLLIAGNKNLITFPLLGASANKYINHIKIAKNFKKIEKTIDLCYVRAPNYKDVKKLLENIFSHNEDNLAFFTGNSIELIAKYIGLETQFIYSSNIDKNNQLSGQNKVIDICKRLNAGMYINTIGGKDLYSKEDFKQNSIELKFLQPKLEKYKQFKNEFVPGLSIIDVLMFNSPKEIKAMVGRYELI